MMLEALLTSNGTDSSIFRIIMSPKFGLHSSLRFLLIWINFFEALLPPNLLCVKLVSGIAEYLERRERSENQLGHCFIDSDGNRASQAGALPLSIALSSCKAGPASWIVYAPLLYSVDVSLTHVNKPGYLGPVLETNQRLLCLFLSIFEFWQILSGYCSCIPLERWTQLFSKKAANCRSQHNRYTDRLVRSSSVKGFLSINLETWFNLLCTYIAPYVCYRKSQARCFFVIEVLW